MKIHYIDEFNCYETTECHKADSIELDGVKLIPITELEKIKAEMEDKLEPFILGERNLKKDALQILDKRIAELKGENNETDN